MTFTERVRTLTQLSAVVLLLNACATAPDAPEDEEAKDAETTSATEEAAPSALPEGPVTPNPYRENAPEVSAEALARYDEALAALEAEDWSDARQRLATLTRDYPELSGPWVNLARVHLEQGREPEAEQALERALQINEYNLEAYNQLALLKRREGDFERAEQLYRQALEVWPFHAESHLNLGILLDLYRGEGEQALLHYRAYQQRQSEPERTVAGWIIDLERRLENE